MTKRSGKASGVEIRYFAEYDSPNDPLERYVWLGRTIRYPGGLRGEVLADEGFERDMTVFGDVSGVGGYTGVRELPESKVRDILAGHPVGADKLMEFKQPQAAATR